MTKKEFKILEKWAGGLGYRLNPKLEYKVKNGIGGIYAREDIDRYEILYSGNAKSIFNDDVTHMIGIQYFAKVVMEYKKGSASDINPLFIAFTPLSTLKKISVYFTSESDLEKLAKLSQSAYVGVMKYKSRVDEVVKLISDELGGNYDSDDILYILLNSDSRSWSQGGFNPILDLFNHSNQYAMSRTLLSDKITFGLGAKRSYKKGEEVYNSYGLHDVYHYIEYYQFFDSNDYTFIDISQRLDFNLITEEDRLIFDEVKKRFNVTVFKSGDIEKYKVNEQLLLSAKGPSHTLVCLVDIMARKTKELIDSPKLLKPKDYTPTYIEWIRLLLNSINLDAVTEEELSEPIKPYYKACVAEVDVLHKCLDWALNNDSSASLLATHEFIKNLENQK